MKKNNRHTFAFLALILTLLGGCAWFGNDNMEKPAVELVQDGVDAYDRGNFREAIKNFEQLKDWYPFSKYAILAELKIADAHYNLKEYPEAVQAYEEFEQLHPRNEAVPYVIYQIGRCHFEQIDTVDRDQTPAQNALDVFRRLIAQYPQDPYAEQARPHIVTSLKSLAGHDFYVAMFYYKNENYKAALERFKTVVTQYPDVGVHFDAMQYIAACEALIGKQELKPEGPIEGPIPGQDLVPQVFSGSEGT